MDCSKCKRTDVKCCYTCQKDADKCKVYHKCGSDCPEYESRIKTNADKIRSMNDEELAEILSELVLRALHFYCGTEAFENINFRRYVEIDMKLEWLQSEAE